MECRFPSRHRLKFCLGFHMLLMNELALEWMHTSLEVYKVSIKSVSFDLIGLPPHAAVDQIANCIFLQQPWLLLQAKFQHGSTLESPIANSAGLLFYDAAWITPPSPLIPLHNAPWTPGVPIPTSVILKTRDGIESTGWKLISLAMI